MRPLRPTESSSLAYKFAMKSELSLSDAIIARKVQLEQVSILDFASLPISHDFVGETPFWL